MSDKLNIVEAVREALYDELESNENVIAYGEDVGLDGGVFRATKDLQEEFGEERVFSTPVAEAGIVGTGVGMAVKGLRPVAEIQFSGFMYQAFHQIKQHVSRYRMKTHGNMNLAMTIRAPYGGGISALEHHCESPENFYVHMQGVHVVIPSDPQSAYSLLRKSIQLDDPVIFLEPKKSYRAFKQDVNRDKEMELGKADVKTEGDDITVIAWGAMVPVVENALEDMEVSVELIDLRTIQPADFETVINSVEKTGRAVVVHEAPKTGGFGGELAARINEEAILHLEAPVKRVTGPDVPYPLYSLEDHYMVNENKVKDGIKDTLEF